MYYIMINMLVYYDIHANDIFCIPCFVTLEKSSKYSERLPK